MYLPHAAKKNQCSIWHLCFMSLLVSSLWISVFCGTFQKSFMALPLEGCRSRIVWRLAASCSNTAAAKVQAGWGWWPQSWHAMAMFFCMLMSFGSRVFSTGGVEVSPMLEVKLCTVGTWTALSNRSRWGCLMWKIHSTSCEYCSSSICIIPRCVFVYNFLVVNFLRSFMMFGKGVPPKSEKRLQVDEMSNNFTQNLRGRCTIVRVLLSHLIWNVRLMSSYFNDFLGSHPCPVVLLSDDSCVGSILVQQLGRFWTSIHKRGGGWHWGVMKKSMYI